MSETSKPHSELLARRFHEAYERLAPAYGYTTRPDSAVPWESVPLMNKRLMVTTVEEACADLFEQLETLRSVASAHLIVLKTRWNEGAPPADAYDALWQTGKELQRVLKGSNPASEPESA